MINKYQDLINQKAQKYGIDPGLLNALVKQESGYNPKAKSPVGAAGLGQLMPGTAKELGVKDVYNPEQNLEGTAKYLSQQLKTFKGDKRKALAAYNAGPGAVQKYGGIPPYKETQNYVKTIMTGYKPTISPTKTKIATKVPKPMQPALIRPQAPSARMSAQKPFIGGTVGNLLGNQMPAPRESYPFQLMPGLVNPIVSSLLASPAMAKSKKTSQQITQHARPAANGPAST